MSSRDRRAAARRRAWGRGPMILRFEPLEGRQLLTVTPGTEHAHEAGEVAITSVHDPSHEALPEPSQNDADRSNVSDQVTTTVFDEAVIISTEVDPTAEALAHVTSVVESTATPISAPAPVVRGGAVKLPDLVATRINATKSAMDWDERFTLSATIANQGSETANQPFRVDIYASPATRIVSGAQKIGTLQVHSAIAPGGTHTFQMDLSTPQLPIPTINGASSYYLVMVVDANDTIKESNEENNVNRGLQGVDAMMVTIREAQPPKLVNAGLATSPGALTWGGTMTVKATVRNEGQGNAPPTNARVVIAPRGDDPFGPRGYTIGSVPMPAVQGLQTVVTEQAITLPQNPPTALANLADFTVVLVTDADEVADPVVRPHVYRGLGIDWTSLRIEPKAAATTPDKLPDLKVLSVENPTEVAWGQTFTVKAKVGNDGVKDAGPFKVRFYMTQGDGPNAPTIALGDVTVPSLDSEHMREVAQTVKLPARVPDGLRADVNVVRIVAHVNPDRALDEAKLENNVVASAPVGLRVVGTDGTSTPVLITPAPEIPAPVPQGQPQTPTPPQVQNPQQPQTPRPPQNARPLPDLAARRAARLATLAKFPRAERPPLRVVQAPNRVRAAVLPKAQDLPMARTLPLRPMAPGALDGPNRIA